VAEKAEYQTVDTFVRKSSYHYLLKPPQYAIVLLSGLDLTSSESRDRGQGRRSIDVLVSKVKATILLTICVVAGE
jgi:hypothetical protein